MSKHIHLDEATRTTLERMCDEYGMRTVAEHTGLSTTVISRAIKAESHGITADEVTAIKAYLKGRV